MKLFLILSFTLLLSIAIVAVVQAITIQAGFSISFTLGAAVSLLVIELWTLIEGECYDYQV